MLVLGLQPGATGSDLAGGGGGGGEGVMDPFWVPDTPKRRGFTDLPVPPPLLRLINQSEETCVEDGSSSITSRAPGSGGTQRFMGTIKSRH